MPRCHTPSAPRNSSTNPASAASAAAAAAPVTRPPGHRKDQEQANSSGETFSRLWRTNAYGGDFPGQFAHVGFLTFPQAQRLRGLLQIRPGQTLADLACGTGGPGLWMAWETGASLTGIDPSPAGLAAARQRAAATGQAGCARFQHGTFAHTSLADAAAGAVMSIDAFQYAPGKRAAFTELTRILRPGARAGIIFFEVDPATVQGLPVAGVRCARRRGKAQARSGSSERDGRVSGG